MINIGDKVVITKLSGKVLETPQVATVKNVGESLFEIQEEINRENVVFIDNKTDEWRLVEGNEVENRGIPEVGDRIVVTRLNGDVLYEPALVASRESSGLVKIYLTDLFKTEYLQVSGEYADEWFLVKDLEKIESTPKVGQTVKVECQGQTKYGEVVETDVSVAGEYEFKVKSGDSSKTYKLNQVDSIESYEGEEDKIMPNYIQLASQGMTFSEFAGEDITEESLNFRPYDDKVNHPSHYNRYSREVIESIKGLCTPDEFRGYLKGNIIKYSARYSGKDGIQDIDKLAKYTQFLKEFELEMAKINEEE